MRPRTPSQWRRRATSPAALATLAITLLALGQPAVPAWAGPATGLAPGGPGTMGYWDSGRKMGVGTAFGRQSKVWFTITGGILSEVYYPTVDTPNVGTMQYVIVDGHGGVQREGADTLHTIRLLDTRALAYEVTNTARDGSYRIITDYACDPARNAVLLHSHFAALKPSAAADRLYVLLRPNVNGTSLGNSAAVRHDGSHTTLIVDNARGAYGPVAMALAAASELGTASVGYRFTASDAWRLLQQGHGLARHYDVAPNGTIVAAAAVSLRAGHDETLALGFGRAADEAAGAADGALATPFAAQLAGYVRGWHGYAATLTAPAGLKGALLRQFYLSALTLKAAEDKTYPGAIVASPTIPWGNAIAAGSGRIGGYHLVWARDLYEVASALLAAGDRATALDALHYLFDRQQGNDGSMPQNTWLNGDPNGGELQLDQVAYPLILAWQLGLTDPATYRKHIAAGANFLVRNGPAAPDERWEEAGGYSPSTLAAEIAGLICAAAAARRNGDRAGATLYTAVADDWARQLASWSVTRTGHLSRRPYYIRIDDNTNPNDGDVLGLANGGGSADERDVVDAGFLELVRLGVIAARDPLIANSVAVVDAHIRVQTRNGPAWHRYNHDGYGEQLDGSPYTGSGVGRLWPIFDGERGEYDLAGGQAGQAHAMLATMQAFAYGAGMIPEQVWDGATIAAPAGASSDDEWSHSDSSSIGLVNGSATGSAGPLDWSMAQYVRLAADLGAGRLLEQPQVVASHYQGGVPPSGPPLAVTAPPANHHHYTSPLLVQGRTTPGSHILIGFYMFSGQRYVTPAVRADGRFSVSLTLGFAGSDLVIVATDSRGRSTVAYRHIIHQV